MPPSLRLFKGSKCDDLSSRLDLAGGIQLPHGAISWRTIADGACRHPVSLACGLASPFLILAWQLDVQVKVACLQQQVLSLALGSDLIPLFVLHVVPDPAQASIQLRSTRKAMDLDTASLILQIHGVT